MYLLKLCYQRNIFCNQQNINTQPKTSQAFKPNPKGYLQLLHFYNLITSHTILVSIWQDKNNKLFYAAELQKSAHTKSWRKTTSPFCFPDFVSLSASPLRGVECSLYLLKEEEGKKKPQSTDTITSLVRIRRLVLRLCNLPRRETNSHPTRRL